MAITLHEKYSKQIQTAYVRESLVVGALSNDYDFTGVKTVKVVTPQTVAMVDYTRSGSNRYGTPTEMEDVVQELTLSQDKAFSLTIDKGNNMDQNGVKAAGKMLALQIAERAVPLMDSYVLNKLSTAAGTITEGSSAITKNNVVERIANGTQALDDAEVPDTNRTLFVTAAVYKFIKLAPEFTGIESLGEKSIGKGVVGQLDGMKVVKVPASRMPKDVNFIIVHKSAGCAPVKLNDTKLHVDPPGISGNLLEGRQYYDCFVFDAKKKGVYVDKNTAAAASSGYYSVSDNSDSVGGLRRKNKQKSAINSSAYTESALIPFVMAKYNAGASDKQIADALNKYLK